MVQNGALRAERQMEEMIGPMRPHLVLSEMEQHPNVPGLDRVHLPSLGKVQTGESGACRRQLTEELMLTNRQYAFARIIGSGHASHHSSEQR